MAPHAPPTRDPRPAITRLVRRHRRPLAAVLAAAGVLIALASLAPGRPDSTTATAGPASPTGVLPGEVAVPIALVSAGVAATLEVGDVIDIVGLTGRDTVSAAVVAPRARVLELPTSSSALSSSSSAVVLVAVEEADALPLAAAAASGGLSVLIRSA